MKNNAVFKFGLLFAFILCVVFSSCKKDEGDEISPANKHKGHVEFAIGFNQNNLRIDNSLLLDSIGLIKYVVISIENSSGETIYEQETIELLKFGEEFISEPIPLETGTYTLTKFMLTDSDGNVLYATPLNNSPLAHLVSNPLPIDFAITTDHVTKVMPQVVKTEGYYPADFGYATFSFQIVDSFSFMLGIFKYNDSQSNLELTTAQIQISGDGNGLIYSGALEAVTNQLTLSSEHSMYTLRVTKQGYETYNQVFTYDELSQYSDIPLTIILNSAEYTTIIIQPDGAEGKDAQIWSYDPTGILDRGTNRQDIVIYEWTKNGEHTTKYGLIDFDLTNLPQNIEIANAEMTLFFDPNSVDNQYHYGHCTQAGPNEAYVRRVTSEWEEPVHWNIMPSYATENEILLPASTSPTQNYTFDVTNLINDSYNDIENSYGFIIQMKDQQYYKSLIFASSEHSNSALHPKLVVTYKNN